VSRRIEELLEMSGRIHDLKAWLRNQDTPNMKQNNNIPLGTAGMKWLIYNKSI